MFIREDCRQWIIWEFSSLKESSSSGPGLMTFSPFMTSLTFMTFRSCCNRRPSWAFGGNVTLISSTGIQGSSPGENFWCACKAIIHQYSFRRPTPTSTLCEADIYQYPLRGQHLPVLIASPSSTSTLWYEMTPSIVRGADFSIVRGAVFSIIRGAVFSIVRVEVFSLVRGDIFQHSLRWCFFALRPSRYWIWAFRVGC